jgi:hypothetical protein
MGRGGSGGPSRTSSGSSSGGAVLQREQLESSNRENLEIAARNSRIHRKRRNGDIHYTVRDEQH